ncbi:MAG: bifunctional methylenetetrahydrofolate dehydrogenase/methenyltetrahydrofolate cyclohydrolase FolD [Alphaproteobacteria bacterium]|nr:bifunctional methylenetetrahydrofolate dehydrogenase/methenyltetrahydrofolate cyclohydrolase FolD [Alphaproteobacteria bacterium]
MTAQRIDGKALAVLKKQETVKEVKAFLNQTGIQPSLHVLLIGDHPPSHIYVQNKRKACEFVGIKSVVHQLPSDVSQADVLDLIRDLNQQKDAHGILVQLPLPQHLNTQEILEALDPKKDVDGLHPYNLGRLLMNKPLLVPCTPQGCLQLIQSVEENIQGKTAVIIGRSLLVGRSLAALLTNYDVTVTLAHSKTKDLKEIASKADILVAAIGSPEFITKDYIKKGAIVIDVGINRLELEDGTSCLKGDVDFKEVASVASFITPVPGGVGPMTISNLLINTVKAAQLHAASF